MDPNSSPWAYAYNRIVPSASGSSDDFQHTHLAQISAAAGSSAQSLLLQAAHSSIAGFNATSGNFVPPTPIGGYNPVFQQIYHHAAQAAVQPKPAHYASSAVSTSHRHLGLSGTAEKQEICRSQPAALGYTTNQSINIPTSSYYGENSSSSGASPSPTTSATSSTTLSWNTPVIGTPQQMSANTFLTMHQQQQQAQQQATINQVEKVINSKQSNLQMKAHSKNYEDLIYVGNHQQEHEENTLQLDNQIIQAVSEEDCARSEEGFYTFVDGKLSYNIPAAAISSASLPNKMPISSIKVVTPRKHSSSESHHPTLQQGLRQIPSPAYPIYESPSLCSSVGSPPPAVNSVHNNESANNSTHNNVYKSNTPTQQAQTSLDVSNVGRGANSNNNRNNSFARNSVSNSSISPSTSVGYSSVITSAFQAQQQQQLQQEHHQMQQPVCWPGSSTNKLSDINKHDQKVYSIHSPHAQENNIYILPPSLQIKRTIIETVQQSSELPQASPQVHQQMVENALHVMSSQRDAAKQQPRNQLQPIEPQQIVQSKQQHSVENVLATNNSQASQIQNTTKVEEVQKPIPTKKAPRKRQPKKTLLQNNDFSRTSQQNTQTLQQPSRQQQQQQIQHHQSQQQQQQQVQQQQQQQHNSSFYDYNNRWMQPKVENNINIPTFGNNQSQQTNPVPQPAHVQSSQTHPHISQISQYYPAFPQHVSTQYAACMSQNTNLYNLTPLGQDTQQEQQQQQNVHQNAQDTLQQQITSEEVQTEPETESLSCKVIVPNIEDELHFLTTADPKVSAKVQNNSLYCRDSANLKTTLLKPSSAEVTNTYPPFEKKDGPGKKSAFMDSYLKFLQGERDESPPPLMKTGRKYNYQKPCIQKEYVNNNKRKSNDNSHSSNTPTVTENTSPAVEGSAAPATNSEGTITGSDDGHKIKIISQTQILPKKRPQAQNMAAVIQQNPSSSEETPQQHQLQQQQQLRVSQQQHSQQYRQIQPQTQNFHQDPLALPPRREQSLRKAKARGINEIMQATPSVTDRDEPEEFADSDADPVWTPQDDDSEDGMPGNFVGKRKNRRIKPNPSKKKDSSATKDDSTLENDNVNKIALVSSTSNNISENTSGNATDNFKTGDFIVLRSDLVNDWPIIWQVDSKCILQKYESFCQNGKMFYRNMSKYASWNLDTKKLYIKAPVRIQVQSHTETIVEFMRSELLADDTEQFIEKIMEDYLTYRDHFEIYIQTMISQVLDPSFFSEINREKDEYFLSSVRTIDEIMENCKRKLLSITPWTRSVIVSIETWPQCHVFTEWGQNNVNQKNCGGCHQPGISVRFLLFGHPYNTNTMQTVPVDMRVAYEKDILLCRICAARADIFHKIAHEKYNLFAICTRRVGEHQKELPGKSSTDILNDLLAENNWVDELFRNMRSSWAEVESLERQKRFHEVSQ